MRFHMETAELQAQLPNCYCPGFKFHWTFTDFPFFQFVEMKLTNDGCFLLDVVFDKSLGRYRAVVYDLQTGQPKHAPLTPVHVHTAAISVENNCFLLGLFDGGLELYNLDNGSRVQHVTAHSGAVHCIRTTSDGTVAMTTAGALDSKDRSIRLWDVGEKIALLSVFTPDAKISSMALADDGQLVALEMMDVVPFWLVRGGEGRGNCKRKHASKKGSTITVDLKKMTVVNMEGKESS